MNCGKRVETSIDKLTTKFEQLDTREERANEHIKEQRSILEKYSKSARGPRPSLTQLEELATKQSPINTARNY